jgi:hypothetical protein
VNLIPSGRYGDHLLVYPRFFIRAVIDETTSHSTKPASWQVVGYLAQAGIQLIINLLQSWSKALFRPLRGVFFCWIPACAGMTALNGKSGFMAKFNLPPASPIFI